MSAQTKTALKSTIDSQITTNGANSITGAQLNAILDNTVDSYEDFIVTYTYTNLLAIASPTTGQKALVSDFPNSGNNTLFIYTGTYWKPWCGSVVLDVSATSAGTPASTVETTLATYTLPASYLLTDLDYIEVEAWGTVAANAQGKNLRLYFGASVTQFGGTSTANNYDWKAKMIITRTSATVQTIYNDLYAASSSGNWGGQTTRGYMDSDLAGGETLSGAIVIKFTGENAVATANDIVLKGWKITLHRK